MKSLLISFLLKVMPAIALLTLGFTNFSTCKAQFIIGKWKGGVSNIFYSVEYAKQTGKSEEEKSAKELGNYETEFKSDHTYLTTLTAPGTTEITTMKGTWSLNGSQLSITPEPKYNPKKMAFPCTIALNGNTLVTTTVFPPPARMIKTIAKYTRL